MSELTQKIRDAIKDMYSLVHYDDKEHRYTRVSDGKFMAGVSSVCDVLPKPYLMPWAAKMVVEWIKENARRSTEKGHGKYGDKEVFVDGLEEGLYVVSEEELEEAKGAYRKVSKEAMEVGTGGHAYLETLVKARIRHENAPNLKDKALERPISQFLEWEAKNVKEWLLSEARVCDPELELAGTLDGMFISKDDKLTICDFKFANNISASYHLQTAAYALPFERYGIEIQDRVILRLPKTDTKKDYDKETRKYSTVPNNLEVGRSPFSYEFDKATFLHLREAYKYINATE